MLVDNGAKHAVGGFIGISGDAVSRPRGAARRRGQKILGPPQKEVTRPLLRKAQMTRVITRERGRVLPPVRRRMAALTKRDLERVQNPGEESR